MSMCELVIKTATAASHNTQNNQHSTDQRKKYHTINSCSKKYNTEYIND